MGEDVNASILGLTGAVDQPHVSDQDILGFLDLGTTKGRYHTG